MGGSSSGTLISAAIKYCKDQDKEKNVVTFVCDNGEKYLNTAYNEEWLKEKILYKKINQLDTLSVHAGVKRIH